MLTNSASSIPNKAGLQDFQELQVQKISADYTKEGEKIIISEKNVIPYWTRKRRLQRIAFLKLTRVYLILKFDNDTQYWGG